MDLEPVKSKKESSNNKLIPGSVAVLSIALVVVVLCLFIDKINSQRWRNRPHRALQDLSFKTGDLLLFNGRSFAPMPTIHFIIKLVTNSDISHVGLIWQDPLTSRLWVWHAAGISKKSKSVYPKDPKRHHYAHLISLEEALDPKHGKVYLRPCSHELDPNRMAQFIRGNLGRDYSFDIALHWYNRKMGLAPLRCLDISSSKQQDNDSAQWSCAELVVNTLCHMQVMPDSELSAAHSYLPNDFSSNRFLSLSSDISYGREVCIDINKESI